MQKTYFSCAETAKLIRAALKEAFPAAKFSVRSETYAGGASINVSWTDGPTKAQGELIADAFAGTDFDGMQDSKVSRVTTYDGVPCSFGADFIFCTRTESAALVERAKLQWSLMTSEARLAFLNSPGSGPVDRWEEDTEDKRATRWARTMGMEPEPSPTAAKISTQAGGQ